jgi:hypothetical protein
MKISDYILGILTSSLSIFKSWSTSNFKELENNSGLSFTVNGFLYKGELSIVLDHGSDAFIVTIGENQYTHIYLDMLVDFIDSKIEKDCDDSEYESKVREFFFASLF